MLELGLGCHEDVTDTFPLPSSALQKREDPFLPLASTITTFHLSWAHTSSYNPVNLAMFLNRATKLLHPQLYDFDYTAIGLRHVLGSLNCDLQSLEIMIDTDSINSDNDDDHAGDGEIIAIVRVLQHALNKPNAPLGSLRSIILSDARKRDLKMIEGWVEMAA